MWAMFVGVGLLFVGKLIMGIIMIFLCFHTNRIFSSFLVVLVVFFNGL